MAAIVQDLIVKDLTDIGLSEKEIRELWEESKPHIPQDVTERSYPSTIHYHAGAIGRGLLVKYGLRKTLGDIEWIRTYLYNLVDDVVGAVKTSRHKPVVIYLEHGLVEHYFVINNEKVIGKVSYDYSYSPERLGYRMQDRIKVIGSKEFAKKFKDAIKL